MDGYDVEFWTLIYRQIIKQVVSMSHIAQHGSEMPNMACMSVLDTGVPISSNTNITGHEVVCSGTLGTLGQRGAVKSELKSL